MAERLSLRVRVFLFFALIAAGGVALIAGGLAIGFRRLGAPGTLDAFVQAGLMAGFGLVGLVAWVWYLFDIHVARATESLAAAIRARAHAEVGGGIAPAMARHLGDLAPAADAAVKTLAETRSALAEAVGRETGRLSAEKARLEALLSDVPVGVLLCTGGHQLVFYNSQALDLLGRPGAAPGLDRLLFDYLREGPVRHAYGRLIEAGDPEAASDLLCATTGSARMLSARMRLLPGDTGAAPGYVLTLRDVTADLSATARREQLLAEVFDRVRRPAANLQTLTGALADGTAGAHAALDAALRAEVAALTAAITELGARYDESRSDWWPLSQTRASDLADSIRARIEAAGLAADTLADALILRCNAFEIVALMGDMAPRIAERLGARAFTLAVEEDGAGALVTLGWQGPPLAVGDLDRWLGLPLDTGAADVTGRSVLGTHATEIWPESAAGTARLCLPLRHARRAGRRPAPIARAVVYDFDLLSRARAARIADTPIDRLTCVVFDSETTGLLPAQGDEMVQLAAVRLVNGRRVEGEVFDTLVNPGRPIPAGSTEVHGITDAMVADAPGVAEAVTQFHKFAEGAVLVAHNAPFDLEFLRRREAALSLGFDHPVLDTVLLSAVVFGQSAEHSLDALCHRLGIVIPEAARHTALGDTVATAEAFQKLVPMLQARGLATAGDVLAEVRRHGRLLKDANRLTA
jgi:DNA polymerase-3 subunit epsilon